MGPDTFTVYNPYKSRTNDTRDTCHRVINAVVAISLYLRGLLSKPKVNVPFGAKLLLLGL